MAGGSLPRGLRWASILGRSPPVGTFGRSCGCSVASPRVDPASRHEVLRIVQFGLGHMADQLMFNPNARPGSADYGLMYLGVGDGNDNPTHTDKYDSAQDPGRPLGKILRINPLRQPNGRAYGIPSGNPFVGRSGCLPEVWALGLRQPQNLTFDRGGSGAFLIADVGQAQIEEINLGRAGANYGLPLRESTFVTDRSDPSSLYEPGSGDAAKGFTYPVAQYDHGEGIAVTGGFVYRGKAIPAPVCHCLLGDIVSRRVFHVPVSQLVPGQQAVLMELTLKQNGRDVTLADFAAAIGADRVDLRFGQDEAGEMYILTKQEGVIRKLGPAAASA